ncbi:MAG: hypothetical protein QNJ65_06905 [Xenococcaceae cyanobacterium MO_234.B1]|nr:hypothetical protein [Xenococcaceae cyanobacterium MO_234.B1]
MSISDSAVNSNSEWHSWEKGNFKIYQSGIHKEGDYIRVYAPLKNIEVPVAILHGVDDKIVKPKEWVKPIDNFYYS